MAIRPATKALNASFRRSNSINAPSRPHHTATP